jgi:fatty-acyl-CoA synthase
MEFNFDLGIEDQESFVQASRSFTLGDQLRKTARMHANRVAVSEPGLELTYAELDERSDRLGNALRERGHALNDSTIAVLSENRGETVTLAFACAKLGCLLATLNWRLEREELIHCAELPDPDTLVVSSRFADRVSWLSDADLDPLLVGYDGHGDVSYDTLVEEGTATDPVPDGRVDPEQGFVALNTSGTTGLPKGVVLSHRSILSRVAQITIDYGLERGDSYPAWAPMFHPGGLTWIGVTVALGGTFYPVDGFDPDRILDVLLAAEEHINWLFLVPGVVDDLVDRAEERDVGPADVPEIRSIGALPDMIEPESIRRVTERFDAPFQNTYGAAEDGHVASGNKIPVSVAPDVETFAKKESPLVAVRLIDEDWTDVEGRGEMAVCGPTLSSGYINNPEANEEDFRDGWFRTGDIFKHHPDGTYSFLSRRKYLVKPGGENVYPAEIEDIVVEHDAVQAAIVVKADDPEWGEVPRLVVATDYDVAPERLRDELMDALDDRLARYKLPHYVKLVEPDRLDRSATGKIVRTEVEEWSIDEAERVRRV